MAADNLKRINCVKVCFTDREYIDLGRVASREDRKVADMVWYLARRAMYGMVIADELPAQAESSED